MEVEEKGVSSQALVLLKGEDQVRIIMYCWGINTLTEAWQATLPWTILEVQSIPQSWQLFEKIDIRDRVFSMGISSYMQRLFCFTKDGGTYE